MPQTDTAPAQRIIAEAAAIQPGDIEAIAETVELLLHALPPAERVRVMSRVIDDLEI